MPLYKKIEEPGYSIGVWKIEEGLPFFEELFHGHPDIQHEHKRLQWFASRHLANLMLGQSDAIVNDDTGKPNFKTAAQNISLSHTAGFAAVMLSSKYAVGIDIEAIHPKIERIAHKFMQPEEIAAIPAEEKLKKITLYWSAKESLFKLYGWGGIEFKTQLLIGPFTMQQSGTFKASIETPHLSLKDLTVNYQFFDGHVLSYVVGS
jgi:prepilin-type processing-associated H-X9-DG protein